MSKDLESRLEPTSRNSVYDVLGGTKDYVLKAISALVREGFVNETDGPHRAKLVESSRPYREDNPVDNPETDPGGSVVRQWFGSGSRTASGDVVPGGSYSPLTGGNTAEPLDVAESAPQVVGWFDEEGNLDDAGVAYIDSLEPDNLDTDQVT